MSQVVLTSTVKSQSFPAGTVGGMWRFTITPVGGTGTVQDTPDPIASFSDVPPGDYTATVQRMDTDGNSLGDPSAVAFTVTSSTVSVEVSDNLTAEVTP